MAKAYVAVPYEDAEGRHEVGDEVEFSRKSDQEKENFDRLIEYGIITTSKAQVEEALEDQTSAKKKG
jgi:hypothetical protein